MSSPPSSLPSGFCWLLSPSRRIATGRPTVLIQVALIHTMEGRQVLTQMIQTGESLVAVMVAAQRTGDGLRGAMTRQGICARKGLAADAGKRAVAGLFGVRVQERPGWESFQAKVIRATDMDSGPRVDVDVLESVLPHRQSNGGVVELVLGRPPYMHAKTMLCSRSAWPPKVGQ